MKGHLTGWTPQLQWETTGWPQAQPSPWQPSRPPRTCLCRHSCPPPETPGPRWSEPWRAPRRTPQPARWGHRSRGPWSPPAWSSGDANISWNRHRPKTAGGATPPSLDPLVLCWGSPSAFPATAALRCSLGRHRSASGLFFKSHRRGEDEDSDLLELFKEKCLLKVPEVPSEVIAPVLGDTKLQKKSSKKLQEEWQDVGRSEPTCCCSWVKGRQVARAALRMMG